MNFTDSVVGSNYWLKCPLVCPSISVKRIHHCGKILEETDLTALVRCIKEVIRKNLRLSHEIVVYVFFFHDVLHGKNSIAVRPIPVYSVSTYAV